MSHYYSYFGKPMSNIASLRVKYTSYGRIKNLNLHGHALVLHLCTCRSYIYISRDDMLQGKRREMFNRSVVNFQYRQYTVMFRAFSRMFPIDSNFTNTSFLPN